MKIAKSFVASILSFALIFTLYVKPTAAAYNSVQPSFSTQQEEHIISFIPGYVGAINE